jgi:hypothetical protein
MLFLALRLVTDTVNIWLRIRRTGTAGGLKEERYTRGRILVLPCHLQMVAFVYLITAVAVINRTSIWSSRNTVSHLCGIASDSCVDVSRCNLGTDYPKPFSSVMVIS